MTKRWSLLADSMIRSHPLATYAHLGLCDAFKSVTRYSIVCTFAEASKEVSRLSPYTTFVKELGAFGYRSVPTGIFVVNFVP